MGCQLTILSQEWSVKIEAQSRASKLFLSVDENGSFHVESWHFCLTSGSLFSETSWTYKSHVIVFGTFYRQKSTKTWQNTSLALSHDVHSTKWVLRVILGHTTRKSIYFRRELYHKLLWVFLLPGEKVRRQFLTVCLTFGVRLLLTPLTAKEEERGKRGFFDADVLKSCFSWYSSHTRKNTFSLK